MTRFQIAVITDKGIWTSTEFNGNGYLDGYGQEVYEELDSKINTVDGWKKFVTEFNKEHFQYPERLHYYASEAAKEKMLNMSIDYFDNWFSDYIYIKNISHYNFYFTTEQGETTVGQNETAIFNFGKRIKPFDEGDFEMNPPESPRKVTKEEYDCAKKDYEKYKLEWMTDHGYTLTQLICEIQEYADGVDSYETLEENFYEWEFNAGFGSEIWACFDEFFDNEWQERKQKYGF